MATRSPFISSVTRRERPRFRRARAEPRRPWLRRLLVFGLPLLAVLLAINTIVTNAETRPARADGGRVLDLPGGDLHVREDGPRDGPAIVLLHGFASSTHWWEPAARQLARDHRVIRIDLLGHGGSEKPREGYGMDEQARRVREALRRLGVRRAVVAGHSMGGLVGTAMVEQDRRLVAGLAILDSPPNGDYGDLGLPAKAGFVPVLGQALRRIVPDVTVRKNLERAFADGFDVPDQFVRDFRAMTYSSYDSAHRRSSDYREERSLDSRLRRARERLLVVFGDDDRLVEPRARAEYRKVPGARIELVKGTGHTPMYEKPRETVRLLLDWARDERLLPRR